MYLDFLLKKFWVHRRKYFLDQFGVKSISHLVRGSSTLLADYDFRNYAGLGGLLKKSE